jgi:hypothetical protein
LLARDGEAALLEVASLVRAHVLVLALDVPDGRQDRVVAACAHREIEADLIVSHSGAAVGKELRAPGVGGFEGLLHDDVAIGDEEWILILVEVAAHHEGNDDVAPHFVCAVDGEVLHHA